MHELQLAVELMAMADREAAQGRLTTVNKIIVAFGELMGVEPPAFTFCFQQIQSHYPRLNQAILEIKFRPVETLCWVCGHCRNTLDFFCERCGGGEVEVSGGDGAYLEALEGEIDDTD